MIRVVVDMIRCEGHGICAELFPERISLDDWGFPIVDPTPVPPGLETHARRAADLCPTLAVLLRTVEPGTVPPVPPRPAAAPTRASPNRPAPPRPAPPRPAQSRPGGGAAGSGRRRTGR